MSCIVETPEGRYRLIKGTMGLKLPSGNPSFPQIDSKVLSTNDGASWRVKKWASHLFQSKVDGMNDLFGMASVHLVSGQELEVINKKGELVLKVLAYIPLDPKKFGALSIAAKQWLLELKENPRVILSRIKEAEERSRSKVPNYVREDDSAQSSDNIWPPLHTTFKRGKVLPPVYWWDEPPAGLYESSFYDSEH